jgi:capsular exopolysaccharide synthesis family protein
MSYVSDALQRSVGVEPKVKPLPTEEEAATTAVPPIPVLSEKLEIKASAANAIADSAAPAAPAPSVAAAPAAGPAPGKRRAHELKNLPPEIVSFHRQPEDKAILEQLRTLRSRVCEISASRGLKSILVTSAMPAEGKSLVSLNLAVSLSALPKKKILLVDCDLRRPRVQSALNLPNGPGLYEFLAGTASFDEIGFSVSPQLDVIPTRGSENAPEMLHSGRMADFLRRVAHAYDFVLIDSPPMSGMADAELMVPMVDGVLFVVQADSTDFTIATEAVNRLRSKVIGAVLNNVEKLPANAGYYYSGPNEKQ